MFTNPIYYVQRLRYGRIIDSGVLEHDDPRLVFELRLAHKQLPH